MSIKTLSTSLILFSLGTMTACLAEPSTPERGAVISQQQELVDLCDGNTDVRLAYKVTGGGQVTAGHALLSKRGFEYLEVTGECHYTVYTRTQGDFSTPHTGVKHGTLTPAQAEALSADLQLERWDGLTVSDPMNISDASTISFMLDDKGFGCQAGCGTTGAAPSILLNMREHVTALYAQGEPLAGPVEVLVVDESDRLAYAQHVTSSWPMGTPIDPYVVSQADAQTGQVTTHVIDDPDDVAALRALRARHVAGDYAPVTEFIPIISADGTQLFALYVADVAP